MINIDKLEIWQKIMEKCSLQIGRQLLINRKDERAFRFLRAATMLYPDDPDAYYMLGNAYGRLGHHEQALPHLKKAIEKRNDAFTNSLMGVTLGYLRRWYEAFRYLNAAQQMRGYAVDDYLLSLCLANLRRYNEAEQLIRQAIRKDPYRPEFRKMLNKIQEAHARQSYSCSWSPHGSIWDQNEKYRGD